MQGRTGSKSHLARYIATPFASTLLWHFCCGRNSKILTRFDNVKYGPGPATQKIKTSNFKDDEEQDIQPENLSIIKKLLADKRTLICTNLILSKSLINSRAKPRYAFGEYMPERANTNQNKYHNFGSSYKQPKQTDRRKHNLTKRESSYYIQQRSSRVS